jgi:ankyrin repeat protein
MSSSPVDRNSNPFDMSQLLAILSSVEQKIDTLTSNMDAKLGTMSDRVSKVEETVQLMLPLLKTADGVSHKKALSSAVSNQDTKTIELLFKLHKFTPDELNDPLDIAWQKEDIAMIDQLIARGARVSDFMLKERAKYEKSLLHVLKRGVTKIDSESVACIIDIYKKKGIDIDTPSEYGYTLLQRASCSGNEDAVKKLLACGASPTKAGPEGKTAIDYAQSQGHTTIVTLLENPVAQGTSSPSSFPWPFSVASSATQPRQKNE